MCCNTQGFTRHVNKTESYNKFHRTYSKEQIRWCNRITVDLLPRQPSAWLAIGNHGGMINRWPHQKTSTLDDVIARNGTEEIKVNGLIWSCELS